MENLLTRLQDVIQQELAAYKDILKKGGQKKQALLTNDVGMLERIVAHEWNTVKTIRQLEAEREAVIRQISLAIGLDFCTVTLEDIAGLLDGEPRSGLLRLKEELKSVISEIDTVNRDNKGLVDTHMQYTAFCVNLLTGHLSNLGTYSYSGRLSETQEMPTLVLDRSV